MSPAALLGYKTGRLAVQDRASWNASLGMAVRLTQVLEFKHVSSSALVIQHRASCNTTQGVLLYKAWPGDGYPQQDGRAGLAEICWPGIHGRLGRFRR